MECIWHAGILPEFVISTGNLEANERACNRPVTPTPVFRSTIKCPFLGLSVGAESRCNREVVTTRNHRVVIPSKENEEGYKEGMAPASRQACMPSRMVRKLTNDNEKTVCPLSPLVLCAVARMAAGIRKIASGGSLCTMGDAAGTGASSAAAAKDGA